MKKTKILIPIISTLTLGTTVVPTITSCSCNKVKEYDITLQAGEHGSLSSTKITIKGEAKFSSIKQTIINLTIPDDDYWFSKCVDSSGADIPDDKVINSNCTIKVLFDIEQETPITDFKYELVESGNENTFNITEYIGSDIHVKLPAKITVDSKEYTLGTINNLSDSSTITSINMNTCTNIPSRDGKSWPTNLTRLCVSPNNTTYKSEKNCILNSDKDTLIWGCGGSIIPDSVTTIEEYAFYKMQKLESIDLNKVKSINEGAFQYCYNLKKINFRGVSSIYKTSPSVRGPFKCCNNIQDATIDADNTSFKIQNNCLLDSTGKTLHYGFVNATIPDGVETIGGSSFEEANWLKSINCNQATKISYRAFANCKNLATVDLKNAEIEPNSANWQNHPFTKCPSIAEYKGTNALYKFDNGCVYNADGTELLLGVVGDNNLLDTATTIRAYAFNGLKNVKSININKVTNMTRYAFGDCHADKITVSPDNTTFSTDADNSVLIKTADNLVVKGVNKENITIPTNITVIDYSAFEGNDKIKSVDIKNVKSIYSYAFRNCSNLKQIDLKNVTFMLANSFEGCALESVSLDGITSDMNLYAAFKNCKNLLSFNMPNYSQLQQSLLEGCENLTTISCSTVNSIRDKALKGCKKLTSINSNKANEAILTNLSEIYSDAFAGCESLKTIKTGNITRLYDYAFNDSNFNLIDLTAITDTTNIEDNDKWQLNAFARLPGQGTIKVSKSEVKTALTNKYSKDLANWTIEVVA